MGMAMGLGGLLGGAEAGGGLMGGLSMLGSVLSAVSSFIPKDTPDVPMPPAVDLGTATPLPSTDSNSTPATNLTDDQKQQLADNAKRRALLLQGHNPDDGTYAGELSAPSKVVKKTLLGG